MSKNKKIFLIGILTIILILLLLLDYSDRKYSYPSIPEKQFKEFSLYKTDIEVKHAYEKHFQDSTYQFPKGKVKKVTICKNLPLISRLTNREINKKLIVDFVNNHENFDWSETTWTPKESEYIAKFYNYNNEEIGKIWFSLYDCGMTESIPFSPRMKFGGLSTTGKHRLTQIVETYYNE
jgi:hypothetical protein